MKNPKLGDYLLWEGAPAKIIGESNDRQVIIELLEHKRCPHCDADLGVNQIQVIVSSPMFQRGAKSLPTIKDD